MGRYTGIKQMIKGAGAALLLCLSPLTAAMTVGDHSTLATALFARNGVNHGFIGDGTSSFASSNDVDIWAFDLTKDLTFTAVLRPGPVTLAHGDAFGPTMTLIDEDLTNTLPGSGPVPHQVITAVNHSGNRSPARPRILSIRPFKTGRHYLIVTSGPNIPLDRLSGTRVDNPAGWKKSVNGFGWVFDENSFAGSAQQLIFDYELELQNITPVGPVPVPAAVWLFGSGLLGMIGLARRRRV